MEERGVGHELFSEKANPSSQEWIEFFSEKIKAEQNAFLDLFLKQNHPADIAEVLEKLEEDEAFYVFKRCDSELQSSIFSRVRRRIPSRLNLLFSDERNFSHSGKFRNGRII